MNGKLITFDDMRHRQEIDLIGGYVEADMQNTIYRGELDDILWWNHYPKRLDWLKALEWRPSHARWKECGITQGETTFDFNTIELFSGPFEFDSAEIFFVLAGRIAITIFPKGCAPPHGPRSGERNISLRRCFN